MSSNQLRRSWRSLCRISAPSVFVLLGLVACGESSENDAADAIGENTGGLAAVVGGSAAVGGMTAIGGAGAGGSMSGTGGTSSGGASADGGGPPSGGRGDSGGTPGVGGGGSDGGSGGEVQGVGGGAVVYDYAASVESTGIDCVVPEIVDANTLPEVTRLPDPFMRMDGTRLTKKSEWRCRRQEIHKQAEAYIYGEKPPKPQVVTGVVSENAVNVHVEAEGTSIDFSARVVLPSEGQTPFPAIINVGGNGISLGESRILEQGVAIIYYNHGQVGTEGQVEAPVRQPNSGLFYDIYGANHSAGLLMAWAWGASRLIDVLQDSDAALIDSSALGVTGCSRNGKGAFAVGVFDERIALTIPHETSTAGVPLYRLVDIMNTERTDHNYNGLNWLSTNFAPFVYDQGTNTSLAVKLPIDSHEMVAMIAPRGLLVLENPDATQMSAPAGHIATVAGREVYKALGVEGNVSYYSNVSGQHCSYKEQYTAPLIQNIAKFLKHESEEPGAIVEGGNDQYEPEDWILWETPTLSDDP